MELGNEGWKSPHSPEKWAAQVVGGIISNRFGKATDTHLKGEGVGGAIVGHYYKFMVETTSNTVPNVIK